MSLTAWGLAWPLVRMTWPTKNLKTPSLPLRNLATLSGFLAMTSRAAASMGAVSLICARPSAATISEAARPGLEHGGENFFADGAADLARFDQFQ